MRDFPNERTTLTAARKGPDSTNSNPIDLFESLDTFPCRKTSTSHASHRFGMSS